jgi:hypothetical protein
VLPTGNSYEKPALAIVCERPEEQIDRPAAL